jgi:hypothetical protein
VRLRLPPEAAACTSTEQLSTTVAETPIAELATRALAGAAEKAQARAATMAMVRLTVGIGCSSRGEACEPRLEDRPMQRNCVLYYGIPRSG